jgi:hypothetical protein
MHHSEIASLIMIIIDVSNIAYAAFFQHMAMQKSAPLHEGMLRHLILNSLRSNVAKFRRDYAKTPASVVLAFDSPTYWRRDLFPHYKANRKAIKAASPLDWIAVRTSMDLILGELKTSVPYKSICVEGAEADDIIGTLAPLVATTEKVMIISGDKDFPQLQAHENVSQWAPVLKKFIIEQAPAMQLKQLIIRGDKDDGIPNILSPDDVFVSGGRQRPISQHKLIQWLIKDRPEDFCDDLMLRNFYRNQKLIDLSFIPAALQQNIVTQFHETVCPTRATFLKYLTQKQLGQLLSHLDEF